MKITDFLEARILEDETEAKERAVEEWFDGGWPTKHCNKILAECAAKRATSAACREDYEDSLTRNDDVMELATTVLYLMAFAYSTHPDYQREWAE